jgi:hypothetical protein
MSAINERLDQKLENFEKLMHQNLEKHQDMFKQFFLSLPQMFNQAKPAPSEITSSTQ